MTHQIDTQLTYAALASLHRPTDSQAIAAEIRRLHASGLTAHDIAAALGLDQAVVRNALEGAIRAV